MKQEQIINSALWAAYGDALGFVTELGNESTFNYRLYGHREAWGERDWRRRIGGKGGVEAVLPAGTYSDDTQLRLAVSRAITGNGVFVREAFAKIELPVWRSYALGAGLGTLAAAENITKLGASWHSNQFKTPKSNYYGAGGNGAAMRIQPHIWSSTNITHPNVYLLDVLSDAIITHGHGRGILGAAFHAICLASTLKNGSPISPKMWHDAVHFLLNVPVIMDKELELSSIWIQQWQEDTKENFQTHVNTIVDEFRSTISMFDDSSSGSPASRYESFARKINAVGGKEVGSGVKTSILAMAAAYLFRNEDPEACLKAVAGLLHSDTDTIATMAGALIGASATQPPAHPVQDREYIASEAKRLANLSNGICERFFAYPSVISWRPQRAPLDQVYASKDGVYLAGLGKLELGETQYTTKTTNWRWGKLPFGQTVLTKSRPSIPESQQSPQVGVYEGPRAQQPPSAPLEPFGDKAPGRPPNYRRPESSYGNLLSSPAKMLEKKPKSNQTAIPGNTHLGEMVDRMEKHGFPPEEVGRAFLEIFARGQGMEALELLLLFYKKFQQNK